eukprot:TRINITY_DN10079_c0_g1_i1.p2 TRINITY_DN10079_c0_g1~~TRINITY_DN10079_c0_g1_i1.p2  ORF type:complete len:280 (-),score=79.55 TRINITY_DN10079_c0_g1_i1:1369-2208(-)
MKRKGTGLAVDYTNKTSSQTKFKANNSTTKPPTNTDTTPSNPKVKGKSNEKGEDISKFQEDNQNQSESKEGKVIRKSTRPKFTVDPLVNGGIANLGRTGLEVISNLQLAKTNSDQIFKMGLILKAFEVWGKNLYPFLTFDELIDRLEACSTHPSVIAVLNGDNPKESDPEATATNNTNTAPPKSTEETPQQTEPTLTAEQLQRIEQNRQQALLKRKRALPSPSPLTATPLGSFPMTPPSPTKSDDDFDLDTLLSQRKTEMEADPSPPPNKSKKLKKKRS